MKLEQLIANLSPQSVWGDKHAEISGIAYDSRKTRPGFLFIAVPGFVTDGHKYIQQAIKSGASALIISEAEYRPADFEGTVILVSDSRRALSSTADIFYGRPSRKLHLIGVTGTNGKTTTAFLIANILRTAGRKVGLLGTIEYQIGDQILPAARTTPESLDLADLLARMVNAGCEYAVMEVSSHSLALNRVADCHFKTAVFTNLTPEHLDYHKNMEDYFQAKYKLFQALDSSGTAVSNFHQDWGQRMVKECQAKVWSYSLSAGADISVESYAANRHGLHARLNIKGQLHELRSPLLGEYNLDNLMAACAVCLAQGMDWATITLGIAGLKSVPGRFEPVICGQDFTLIVDYAHTEDALLNLLKGARRLNPKRLITVFGCGGQRDRQKRPLMGAAAYQLSDFVIVTSDNPRLEDTLEIIHEVEQGISALGALKDSYHIVPDRRQAIMEAINLAEKDDLVVLAGKGHENYQIIGDKSYPFDDRLVAREILGKLFKG
ncbi:MAG: UDP-N-acetylmuramoyl-L-alanyl-D-glutamate--2,6-diaminopimelate ligase [Candidatus Schekmanbacteria bacterium]|nr:UDP-N-acetylmuramoyl-L-alanyl-D-glutamate--2,6-diaminopimelate ligase [Candidatus Schekmanbacteria bacterium]